MDTLSQVIKNFFNGFDFIVSGDDLESLKALIELKGACRDGGCVPSLPITAFSELSNVRGQKILLLGVSASFGRVEYRQVVDQLKRLIDNGNKLVCVVDFTEEGFWQAVQSDIEKECELPQWTWCCDTVSADDLFDGAYQRGEKVAFVLGRTIVNAVQMTELKYVSPLIALEDLELVWNSQIQLNPIFFHELGLHFSGDKFIETVQTAIVEAHRQKREADRALREAEELSNGVWKVNLPAPETAVTNIMAEVLAKKEGVKAIIGKENNGSGPFLKIQIFGKERDDFTSTLGQRNIRFSLEESKIPENMRSIRVHYTHQAELVEILTGIN